MPQILPLWIFLLDQLQLPCPVPFLQLLLSRDRGQHVRVRFIVNQSMNPVLLCEPVHEVVLVFPRTLGQIAGNSDIKRAVLLARQNVDGRLPFHNQPGFPFSRE